MLEKDKKHQWRISKIDLGPYQESRAKFRIECVESAFFTELRFWFCNWLRWKICLCRFVFYPLHKTNLKKVHTPRNYLKTPQNCGVQRERSGGGRDKAAVSWPLLSFDQPSLQVQSQQNSQINVERHRLRHAEYRAALMGNECHSRVQSSCHHALTLKMEKTHKNLSQNVLETQVFFSLIAA